MSKPKPIVPWKTACVLRKEIRERQLKEDDFAVDLFRIVQRPPGKLPFYCDPDQFFATTYATENLRKFCAGVLGRLTGLPSGVSLINIAQTFGGGKSHSLATVYYLSTLGEKLDKKHPAVAEILAAAALTDAPTARVAAVSFDKVDWKSGGEVRSPDGTVRSFRMPWNLIAWQLLGERGIEILQRKEDEQDYYEPPAETLWIKVLEEVERQGSGALILLDEFLMWAHGAASPDPDSERLDKGPVWYDRLKNFFQTLSQAVASSEKSCLVVSLLATDPAKRDDVGAEILARCNAGLNRKADVQTPVDRGDFAELLRRRMFERFPKGSAECDKYVTAFWPRMEDIDPARAKIPDSKKQIMDAYPFHPDLINRLFGKWTGLRQFQRTRGILQTFSMALREAEGWDESPMVSTQVLLAKPDASDISPALAKLADDAMNSVEDKNKPNWPGNLRTEMPRAVMAQKTTTLAHREIESACAAAFVFSQPIGEQAELGELRWLLGATVDIPAMLNAGLLEWSKTSWYLTECESTDPASNLPRYWRMGPKPNLNQMHDTYKKSALKNARLKFDELVKECRPLRDGCVEEGVAFHLLPSGTDKVDDDSAFRLVVLGGDYAGAPGTPPKQDTVDFVRTHASPTDPRKNQNLILVVTPSATGLLQAEQAIASWLAWGEIKNSAAFKDLDGQQETVKSRERDSRKDALTAVKNAYELVIYVDQSGAIQQRKFTMGSEALLSTLIREKELRIYRERINAETLLPGHPSSKWPAGAAFMAVKDIYGAYGRYPDLPKLINKQAVINTIADAVRRGLMVLRYRRPGGGEEWFWRSEIDGIVDWADIAEAWLPDQAELGQVRSSAVTPDNLSGLWPADQTGQHVKLSQLCSWFDGTHAFDEILEPGYPAEKRPIPKADYKLVHSAVADAVAKGTLWLVFGNDSVLGEKPSEMHLDPESMLFRPPSSLRAMDLLPGALPEAWSGEPLGTTLGKLYAELKNQNGLPWPARQFLDVVNESVNQGIVARGSAGPEYKSISGDAARELLLPKESPKQQPPKPTSKSGLETTEARFDLAKLQDFTEELAPALTKLLAGSAPTFHIKVSLKDKLTRNMEEINAILRRYDPNWKF